MYPMGLSVEAKRAGSDLPCISDVVAIGGRAPERLFPIDEQVLPVVSGIHEDLGALFQWADKSVGVIEYRVVKIAVWTCERAEHGGELLARSILEPNDRSHLRHLRVMAEGHIREDAQIQIDRRQESLPRVDVQEIADERGIPPEAVGEGIVLESLLLQIEQEGSGIQVQFQVAGGGGGRSLVVSGRSCHLERGE